MPIGDKSPRKGVWGEWREILRQPPYLGVIAKKNFVERWGKAMRRQKGTAFELEQARAAVQR